MNKKSQTILVTGVNGFVGEHLVRELISQGHTVLGADRRTEPKPYIREVVSRYFPGDLLNQRHTDSLPWNEIDTVIHLAGLAAVGPSFDNPELYKKVNIGLLETLLTAAETAQTAPRFISVSTGALYAPSESQITEDSELAMTSPYAESKHESEKLLQEWRGEGFKDSVSVRPFNHIGPGQGPGFLVPDIGFQIKDAPKGATITVGNIETSRDYTDVRDVVRAYRLLAEAESLTHDTYNVCSGVARTGTDMLTALKIAMKREDITIETDPAKFRPTDNMYVCGSAKRLQEDTGWETQISIEKTLQDFSDYLAAL